MKTRLTIKVCQFSDGMPFDFLGSATGFWKAQGTRPANRIYDILNIQFKISNFVSSWMPADISADHISMMRVYLPGEPESFFTLVRIVKYKKNFLNCWVIERQITDHRDRSVWYLLWHLEAFYGHHILNDS